MGTRQRHAALDPLSRALLRRFGPREGTPSQQKAALGILEGWVGLLLNGVLFVIKLVLGLLTGSVALIADAIHTLADSITSGVLIAASRVARKPADREHPYGHGRIESVAAVVIAVLLGVAGIEFLKSSIERVIHPETIEAGWWVVAVVVAAAGVKEWSSRFALGLAKISGSKAIEADAWHHRSDVFATLLVALGIVGCKLGLPILDGVMGIGVSAVILWAAVSIARDAIDPLLGQAPSHEEVKAVAEVAMAVQGVEGVHDIVIHCYGDVRLISLHVETSDQLSALELHTLAETVQSALGSDHGHAVVHVDPINRDHPQYAHIRRVVEEVVATDDRLESFHDLRIVGEEGHFNVVLDVIRSCEAQEEDGALAEQVANTICARTEARAVVVNVEPLFAYG